MERLKLVLEEYLLKVATKFIGQWSLVNVLSSMTNHFIDRFKISLPYTGKHQDSSRLDCRVRHEKKNE